MNWETKFYEMKSAIKTAEYNLEQSRKKIEETFNALKEDLEKQEADYTECLAFTNTFLKCCSRHKIKAVCIQEANDIVEESKTFSFGVYGSVFANGNTKDGSPAIWTVCEEMGVDGGCGNYNQHQLNEFGMAKLIDGAYQFKDGK